jgi:Cof subfamily protein (haloacid dehalogenase superfamily)
VTNQLPPITLPPITLPPITLPPITLPRIRLLGTDLDGTLLHSDGTVSDRTRTALKRAEREGLLVAFATGRPPRWLFDVANATGHTGIAVAANGAVLFDLATDTVIAEHILSVELLAEITSALRARFPDVVFGLEYGDNPSRQVGGHRTFGAEVDYRHDWEVTPARDRVGNELPLPLIADLATIISQPGVKLLAKNRNADPGQFINDVEQLLGDKVSITHSSAYGLAEIGVAGVTKASGLAYVAEQHGIDASEVAVVGDMPNDLPMLAWAGRSYAVANAHTSVLAAAQYRLPTNDDDAVAQLIESLLGEQ